MRRVKTRRSACCSVARMWMWRHWAEGTSVPVPPHADVISVKRNVAPGDAFSFRWPARETRRSFKKKGNIMRRLILATVAGAALLTGATAAGAQTFQGDGYAYSD